MPQPTSSLPKDHVIIYHGSGGDSFMKKRPDVAIAIAEIVAAWGGLELALSHTYSSLLGVRQTLAADIFYSLQTAGPKQSALTAIADRKLRKSPRQRRAFTAVMEFVGSVQRERDKVAHWVYGTISGPPEPGSDRMIPLLDRLALADPRYFSSRNKSAFVYRIDDFQKIAERIDRCANILATFDMALHFGGAERTRQFQKLCSEPELQASLARQEGIPQPRE